MTQSLKEAGLQKPVPTNRNRIRGWTRSVRQHTMSKRLGNNPGLVDAAGISGKRMHLPGEVSTRIYSFNGEVSRSHSSGAKPGANDLPCCKQHTREGSREGLNVKQLEVHS